MVRRSAAGLYRRERWEVPLAAALLELRECAVRLKLAKVGRGTARRPCLT
jgi:inorganic triphosphatase YgiF